MTSSITPGTHHGLPLRILSRTASRLSSNAWAARLSRASSSSWCRLSLVTSASTLPRKGATCVAWSRATALSWISSRNSSSGSASIVLATPVTSCLARRPLFSGLAVHRAARSERRSARSSAATTSRTRKCFCTKLPRMRPMRSFWVATIAVWGIGSPRGRRNRAVTANQSASPPTSDASAVARTKPSHGWTPSRKRAPMKTMPASTSRPVARRRMVSSRACRTASSGG